MVRLCSPYDEGITCLCDDSRDLNILRYTIIIITQLLIIKSKCKKRSLSLPGLGEL